MNLQQAEQLFKELREKATKRKFDQAVDFVLTLRNFDPRKTKIDFYVDLHNERGRRMKICALVGPELVNNCKKFCDFVITKDEFKNYANKKAIKKLASEYDYFIAQMDVMKDVATVFGRSLGPSGKMPNPKAGCVLPANGNVEAVVNKLQKQVRVKTDNTNPQIMCTLGRENQSDAILADNLLTLIKATIPNLPSQQNNVNKAYVKFSMSPAFPVSEVGAK